MRTRISLIIALLLVAGNLFAQNLWHEGDISTRYGTFECRYQGTRIHANRPCNDSRLNLPLGVDGPEDSYRGEIYVSINSERYLYNAVTSAISNKKLMDMVDANEKSIRLFFDLSENGEIIRVKYSLQKETLVTPDEVATMDSLIRKNIRFNVVRDYDFGEPHMFIMAFRVVPSDVLNGEIKDAKRNELTGL